MPTNFEFKPGEQYRLPIAEAAAGIEAKEQELKKVIDEIANQNQTLGANAPLLKCTIAAIASYTALIAGIDK